MTGRKVSLVIVALATFAFVVPTLASAAPLKWKDKGAFLQAGEHATLEFSGNVTLEYLNPENTFSCELNMTLTAEPGTTGTVTKFELKTTSCSGTGIWANCAVTSEEIKPLPLEVHTTESGFELTTIVVEIEYKKGTGCKLESSNVAYSWIIATPNALEPIASITLYGEDSLGVQFIKGSLNAAEPKTLGLG